jgi:hypothetical protein
MDRGFDVRLKSGQGYLPGSQVIAMKAGEGINVAVKASQERVLSFTKQSNNKWRTLHAVAPSLQSFRRRMVRLEQMYLRSKNCVGAES